MYLEYKFLKLSTIHNARMQLLHTIQSVQFVFYYAMTFVANGYSIDLILRYACYVCISICSIFCRRYGDILFVAKVGWMIGWVSHNACCYVPFIAQYVAVRLGHTFL